MENNEIVICHTFYGNGKPIKGLAQNYLLESKSTNYYSVQLKLGGDFEVLTHKTIDAALDFLKEKDLVYRFIEYNDIDNKVMILSLHNLNHSDKFIAYQNYYGIGEKWKLYLNGKNDIVVQHFDFPKTDITIRFGRADFANHFYLTLSCIIYLLSNYNLETEDGIRRNLERIKLNFKNFER